MLKSVFQRLVEAIEINPESGCWEFSKGLTGKGYAMLFHEGRSVYAHRLSYEFAYGPVPEGLVIDHLCVNTKCVKPEHLEAVTQVVNMSRSKWARQTHCLRGHEFTIENTYVHKRAHGPARVCRACKRMRSNGEI